MPVCIICNTMFEAKRADARICSAMCRQRAKRAGIKLRGATGVTTASLRLIPGDPFLLPGNLGSVQIPGRTPQPITKAFFSNNGAVTHTIGADQGPVSEKSFREYLDLIKAGDYEADSIRKEVQGHKKLTHPQKLMIYAKLQ